MPAETIRHRLIRYGIVALIVGVLAGLFVRQQWPPDEDDGSAASAILRGQIEVGASAPDFNLDTLDGKVRLSELRGRVVVVNFWATWCVPCREEMPALQTLSASRGASEVMVLGVNATNLDSRNGATEFARNLGIAFPVAFDAKGDAARLYGVQGLPATFFIDREGVVRARSLGPQTADTLARNVRAAGG